MILKKLLFTLCSLALTVACASATPSPAVSSLSWNAYTDTNAVGFYVYWRADVPGSAYSNLNRLQITNTTAITEAIASVVPATHPSSVCFVLTAYDAAGNESAYSNEACGFMGFTNPAGVAVK